jgi:hypothetical protein
MRFDGMHAVLERMASQIAREVRQLDEESAQRHPGGHVHEWSAQQVIEHLMLSYRLTSRVLESRMKKGRPSHKQDRTYLQWSLQLMILTFGALPRGVPALPETTPVADGFAAMDGRKLGDLLRQEMEAMDSALDGARRKYGMERVAVHPWLGPLRVDQWRRFHTVHGLHHLSQLRSVIARVAPQPLPIQINHAKLVEKLGVPAQRPLA